MSGRIYFPFYHSYFDATKSLSKEEFADLFRAVGEYSMSGKMPELSDKLNAAFGFIKSDIDRIEAEYQRRCKTNKQNINKRWGRPDTTVYDCIPTDTSNTTVYDRIQEDTNDTTRICGTSGTNDIPIVPVDTNGTNRTKCNVMKGNVMERESSPPDGGTHADQEQKHKYGQFGRVRLTDVEYRKLSYDLGETELKRCIDYVDESAQMTDNKNKWKDWNLVLRKCHKEGWGLKQDQTDSNNKDKVVTDDDIFPEVAYYHDRDGVQHCIRRKKP